MAKENILGHQEISMKAIIQLDKKMDSELITELTVPNTKVIGLRANDMEKAYKFILMVNNRK